MHLAGASRARIGTGGPEFIFFVGTSLYVKVDVKRASDQFDDYTSGI